jgi:L-ascorbate metabolism protein UlaG (beta-lactamase superfamily)
VPAYNLDKFRAPGQPFHPREAGYVGFIVTLDGVRYYHAGDTDAIPEMREVATDVALLPVSGTFVMTCEEACHACDLISAQVAVPMHYADIVGDEGGADRFRAGCAVPVTVLPLER